MDRSIYTPLSTREDVFEIRLLRLLPSVDLDAMICCSLITYPLHPEEKPHLYDALSYVWGDPNVTKEIMVAGSSVNVTSNLHAAMHQLRDRYLERILWVDALCIDQGNPDEVSRQILSMARIYGQASCVLVWLGEEADDSDTALEYIRHCGAVETGEFGKTEATERLLKRSWFSRIWVLQETASARRIQVLCGSKILGGHAFSVGVQKLQSQLPVNRLIQQAALRSPLYSRDHIRAASNFNRLGNFLDMYHGYSATKQHDKIYALLGMSAGPNGDIKPDYTLPWHQLFQKTIHHILGTDIRVQTWPQREIAVISGLGFILGTASSINIGVPDLSRAQVTFMDLIGREHTWTMPLSSKLIQKGDLVCLLQGASEATVIRACEDFFQIIVTQVPLQHMLDTSHVDCPEYLRYQHDLLILWDWETSARELQGSLEHRSFADRLGGDTKGRQDSAPCTKGARMLAVAEIVFETNRWRYFQFERWLLKPWPEYGVQDRKIRERLKSVLDHYIDLLQIGPTAILGLMWKVLILYARRYDTGSVLEIVSQALSVRNPLQNGGIWQIVSRLSLSDPPWSSSCNDWDSLEALIIGVEAAESSLLDYLIQYVGVLQMTTASRNASQEAVFLSVLRVRKKILDILLLSGSNDRDPTVIKRVLDLIREVQTPAALALRCLFRDLKSRSWDFEITGTEEYKRLAQRAKTGNSRTNKSREPAAGDINQALGNLLDILYGAELTVTEEMMTVAVETISSTAVETLMRIGDSNIRITQDLLDATQKNTAYGEDVRLYLSRCKNEQEQGPQKDDEDDLLQ